MEEPCIEDSSSLSKKLPLFDELILKYGKLSSKYASARQRYSQLGVENMFVKYPLSLADSRYKSMCVRSNQMNIINRLPRDEPKSNKLPMARMFSYYCGKQSKTIRAFEPIVDIYPTIECPSDISLSPSSSPGSPHLFKDLPDSTVRTVVSVFSISYHLLVK